MTPVEFNAMNAEWKSNMELTRDMIWNALLNSKRTKETQKVLALFPSEKKEVSREEAMAEREELFGKIFPNGSFAMRRKEEE